MGRKKKEDDDIPIIKLYDDDLDDDDIPDCCKACGGPYPQCMTACSIFDD